MRPEPTQPEARAFLAAVATLVILLVVGRHDWLFPLWLAAGVVFFGVQARAVGRVTGIPARQLLLPRFRWDPPYAHATRMMSFLPLRPSWWAAVWRAARP